MSISNDVLQQALKPEHRTLGFQLKGPVDHDLFLMRNGILVKIFSAQEATYEGIWKTVEEELIKECEK